MQYNFFENAEILLCFDITNEKWYIKNHTNGISYDLSSTNNLKSFLQIFHEDPSIFFTNLLQMARENNLSEQVLDSLPIKETIIFCIQNKMFFWIELSLKWLQFTSIDSELKKVITTLVEDPKSPQHLRHKLKKMIH